MKNLFVLNVILLSLVFSSFYAKADSLNCKINNVDYSEVVNHTFIIVDSVKGTCEGHSFDISGIGLGIKLVLGSYLTITCPGAFSGNFKGRYYGVKADIPVLGAGLYYGKRGLCAIGIVGFSAAVGGTGSVLTIY